MIAFDEIPEDEEGLDNLVEVVYEVTVKVTENDPIPEEDIMAQAIVDRFPETVEIKVQRA